MPGPGEGGLWLEAPPRIPVRAQNSFRKLFGNKDVGVRSPRDVKRAHGPGVGQMGRGLESRGARGPFLG